MSAFFSNSLKNMEFFIIDIHTWIILKCDYIIRYDIYYLTIVLMI